MADLEFKIAASWGLDGEGSGQLTDHTVRYSAPDSMGGKGVGTSPEELLLVAVSSCYSGTLLGTIKRAQLPVQEVVVNTVGTVTGYPLQSKFAKMQVNPVIHGGDPAQLAEYQRLAATARDKCFIGKAIAGNVEYVVGEVQIV